MRTVSLEELLEAGCHFGHQVARQNPKARDFIFEARDKIHIIDLEKTKECLEDAGKFVKEIAKKDGVLLVVATKRQAEGILREEIKRIEGENVSGVYFVTKRWIGGTLTNFTEVAKNYKKLKDLSAKLKSPSERAKYTKKEIGAWDKERVKLEGFYSGIADMTKAPDAVFIIDTHHEHVAAQESRKMGVPTVGITDTNADPTIIDYPIPANDDAVGSLKLVTSYIFDAWIEGKKLVGKEEKVEKKAVSTEKSEEPKEEKKAAVKKTEKPKEGEAAKKSAEKTTKKE